MNSLLLIIFLIFVGQTLGCLIGLIKQPKETFLYGSLAFAASMMLGISFFQLIPESLEITPVYLVIISFITGWCPDMRLIYIGGLPTYIYAK